MYTGQAYVGPTNFYKPAWADTLEEAIALKKELTEYNPVGWDIYDSHTKEKVTYEAT